jgi:hypothetical protein
MRLFGTAPYPGGNASLRLPVALINAAMVPLAWQPANPTSTAHITGIAN